MQPPAGDIHLNPSDASKLLFIHVIPYVSWENVHFPYRAANAPASNSLEFVTAPCQEQLSPLLRHRTMSSPTQLVSPGAGLAVVRQWLRVLLPVRPRGVHHRQRLGQAPLVLQRCRHRVHRAVAHDAGSGRNLAVTGVREVIGFRGRYEGVAYGRGEENVSVKEFTGYVNGALTHVSWILKENNTKSYLHTISPVKFL